MRSRNEPTIRTKKNLLSEQYIATDRNNNSDFKVIDKSLLHYKQTQALPKEKTRDNFLIPNL